MLNPVHIINNTDSASIRIGLKLLPAQHKYAMLTDKEKLLLLTLAKTIPNKSAIVEIGTYLGGSASILAHANPNNKIFCFDTFDKQLENRILDPVWISETIGLGSIRTLDSVQEILKEFKNIRLTKVPTKHTVMVNWRAPIDLYFEDGNHTDPVLTKNIIHWSSNLKIGGFMVLHDFRPYLEVGFGKHPDVDRAVNTLIRNDKWKFCGVVDSTAVFQKLEI
jgi:hypothetical protein